MTLRHAYRYAERCAMPTIHSTKRYRPLATLLLLAMISCRGLTDIDAPDLVQPSDLDTPAGALARRAGAVAQFAVAFADQVVQSGVLSDEFTDVAGVFPADRRTLTPENSDYPFKSLSAARIDAVRAIATLKQYNPTPPARIGELYALVGFANTMFVENMCMPVPIALMDGKVPISSRPASRDALIDEALAMFDSAARYSDSTDAGRSLASIGRARAELLRGDLEAAASAVATVPMSFVYELPFSATATRQLNRVFQLISVYRTLSVADAEGQNGLPFVSSKDPRVGAELLGAGQNGRPLYNYARNAGLGTSIPLATGVEAALIRAEAALHNGDVDDWAGTLNTLRSTAITPAVPPMPADSTTAAPEDLQVSVMFAERAFWLFGTGHRQGDLRRLIRQYGRQPDSVFPTGEYPTQGLRYGSDVMFVPRGEEPNPAYAGCEDRQP